MKKNRNKKNIQIMIFVMIAMITIGVGYAAIGSINLMINGNATGTFNQSNFKVKFTTAAVTTGTGTANIDSNDPKVATFNVSGISIEGDTAVATYTVLNDSEGIGASIGLTVTNSNTEYFSVTERVADTELQAGDTTTATITVTVIKTPIENDVSTSITGTLTASPLENANATGSASASVTPAPPVVGPAYKYSISENNIGQALVSEEPSFEDAKMTLGYPTAIAHIITGGVIEKSYVAFERNGTVYYLRGGVDESGQESMPIYDANVAILKEAFGGEGVWPNYCSEIIDLYHDFYCNDDDFHVYVDNTSGTVGVKGYPDSWFCEVYYDGRSNCFN